MSFYETQFPTDISYGSVGGPEYSTEVVITESGAEYRNIQWAHARAKYNVAYGVRDEDQLASLIAFFRAMRGRAHGFRYKDWTDFEGDDEPIGVGDASEDEFQLLKEYAAGSAAYYRTITKPVTGTTVIYFDGVLQGSGWSVSTTTGIVTFTAPPGVGVVITADFEFDVPVRFDIDRLSVTLDDYGLQSAMDVPLVEIRV